MAINSYRGKILEHAVGESKNSKTPQITFSVEILDGDRAGAIVYVHKYLTEKAIENTVKDLRSLGWGGTDFAELFPGGSQSFAGREVRVYNKPEKYEGEMKDKWNFSFGLGLKPTEDVGLAKRLNASFGGTLKMTKPAAGANGATKPQQPQQQQQATGGGGQEIPF